MPVETTRRIGTARFRGQSEPLIHRAAGLLEDALRTASLPDADGERVLLIRSLPLGPLRPEKGAASVAQQLEQQVAELARQAVHGGDPRAAEAQAVYFHDRLDAVIVLIQRLAQGPSDDGGEAWFWRSAIPGWRPGTRSADAGRLLLGCLFNREAGSQPLAQAFQRLIRSGSLDMILHALQEQDGPVLLQRCRWRDAEGPAASGACAATRAMPFPVAWQAVLLRWVTRWGPSDDRSLWLVAVAVQTWQPEHSSHPGVVSEAKAVLRAIAGSIDGARAVRAPDDQRVHVIGESSGAEPAVRVAPQPDGTAVYTPFAGFWFLVPLMARAGFGRAIQDHPEWVDAQVPRRILRSLADRLSIPPEDAICLWLSDHREREVDALDPARDAMVVDRVDAIVAQWRKSMRRWCRLEAGLGMRHMVCRPGWVSSSGPYVDIWMPLSESDLRIRRAGLDIDPGWVPWLEQVVRFHYDTERRSYGTGGSSGN